jgi:hypothetical protein
LISFLWSETQAKLADKGSAKEVKRALGILFASFPAQAMSEETAEMRMTGFAIALDGIPAWAVQAAVKTYLQTGSAKFAPTPPELRSMAEAAVTKERGFARMLRTILDAKERGVEPERKYVGSERIKELVVMIGGKS